MPRCQSLRTSVVVPALERLPVPAAGEGSVERPRNSPPVVQGTSAAPLRAIGICRKASCAITAFILEESCAEVVTYLSSSLQSCRSPVVVAADTTSSTRLFLMKL
jgi:hypothetical protein